MTDLNDLSDWVMVVGTEGAGLNNSITVDLRFSYTTVSRNYTEYCTKQKNVHWVEEKSEDTEQTDSK